MPRLLRLPFGPPLFDEPQPEAAVTEEIDLEALRRQALMSAGALTEEIDPATLESPAEAPDPQSLVTEEIDIDSLFGSRA